MEFIELRSDTCTLPTKEMRQAMAAAEVGDDVYGEDPTVNALEELSADIMGKEAALFLASGTMANLVAILTHCRRGEEIILEADSHIYYYECGGLSALAGAFPRPLPGKRGFISPEQLQQALRPPDIHFPATTLLCLENTHNRGGGSVLSVEKTEELAAIAHRAGLKVHLDGARIFNAALALDVDVKKLAAPVDSVMFCLSKGLSAPAGSILAGSREFIEEARRQRKLVGGGMRQAGILAAAGLVALNKMRERLHEDHEHAQLLAAALEEGGQFRVEKPETNIINVWLPAGKDLNAFIENCRQKGLLITARGPGSFRLVTNRHIGKGEVKKAVSILYSALNEL
ncbi:MAG: low-specificity L-threonine aldolase [Firmicutes bacterium]|nr:low-specificity L-threonine aldolase [Bacillota bacterium]